MKLSEVLKKHTVRELKEMAKDAGIQGYSKWKKEKIISSLEASLLKEDMAKQTFLCADEKEMKLFCDAINREIVMKPDEYYKYVYFFISGYFYLSEHNSIIVPDEVKDLYECIFTEDFRKEKERFDLIIKYATAAANLYGVVAIDKVTEIFNIQNEEKADREEFVETISKAEARDIFCYLSEQYLVHEAIDSDIERNKLLFIQQDKLFYQPKKDQFLKFADDDYFERNEEFLNLKNYIVKNVMVKEEEAEELCDDIQLTCCLGEGPSAALNEFLRRNIEFQEQQQVYEVGRLISALNNSTRMWCNRGFTPNEIVELRSGKKPGRNDPCPCGSGKKYKYCCGK